MIGLDINSIRKILNSTEPLDCFKLQFRTLQLLGAFENPSAKKFFQFVSLLPSILLLKLCVTSVMYLVAYDLHWEDKLQSSFVSNTALLCAIKMFYIRKNRVKLLKLVTSLKARVNDLNADETKLLNEEAIYPTAASYLFLQAAIFGTSVIYNFFPIGKNNEGKPLPVYAWYPHYFNQGITYKVVYFLQEMSITCAGTLWVCVDTINFGLLAHHNVMLKILCQRIAKLGWTGKDKCGECHVQNYRQLCENVQYHVQILKYQRETNQIYSSTLFAKVTMSVIIICSFLYSLTYEHEQYGGLVAQFVILCVIVGTLFVITWLSENISASSDQLLNKAVECNFQCMDHRTTKALITFMQGLSTTVCIEVGSAFIVRLNLKMFVTIMEFAYKCLALLKTVAV